MAPHFGSKVTGHEEYDKAVRTEVGGGNVFGTRVRGAIPETGPTNIAKRNSEFGVGVLDGAHGSDTEGNHTDTVSIEQLRNLLTENPTFFDSLYEAELARNDGARPDALAIFYEVERGIKGQMRPDVMSEIRALMGQKGIDSAALADQAKVRVQAQAEMAQRNEENKLLADAGRVKDLRERAENISIVKDAQKKGDVGVQVGFTTEAQESRIAGEQGIALPGAASANATGTVPSKPSGPVSPATQTAGGGSPSGANASAGGSSPAGGAGSEKQPDTDKALDEMTKAELEDYLGEDAAKVKGTGAGEAVVKDDLLKAAKKKAKKSASE